MRNGVIVVADTTKNLGIHDPRLRDEWEYMLRASSSGEKKRVKIDVTRARTRNRLMKVYLVIVRARRRRDRVAAVQNTLGGGVVPARWVVSSYFVSKSRRQAQRH